ncbi:tetratricopeptide repeat-containing sensor histidine kinase [Maribacter sp. CXY002]|uniref:tetratricopeptide repeat-containing sensor histidine kinase n=1 Tax=Maribacter luteocoastalis TaxID=3407671 RepID=UPI003B6837D5
MGNTLTFRHLNFRITLFILSFLLITGAIQAQNSKIDSLKNELALHTRKDTTRVNLLNTLAFSHFGSDMAKTLKYLEEADAMADSIHFRKGKARSIYIRGITEAIQSNFDQALSYYNAALKLYTTIDFKKGIANSYNAMGITYRNKGQLKKAIEHFKGAIRIEEEIGSDNLSASLLNLGTANEQLGNFDEAILYLKKALSIAKSEENEQRVAYSLNNLGIVYNNQGNYPLALEHHSKSLYMNEKLGDSISMAHNLSNIGSIYKIQKYYDKAMMSYQRSLGIYERINSKLGISSSLNGIGAIHEENGDYKKALDHYLDALRIGKQIGANSETPNILNNIGGIYLAFKDYNAANRYFTEAKKISLENESQETLCGAYIGLARTYANQKAYNRALSYVIKAEEISKKTGFLEYQKQASEVLSKIYNNTGNYKKALESHQQFKILNDSLFNKENVEKIAQLEYEYKYKQALDSASIRELKLTKTVMSTSQDLAKSRQNYLWAVIGILIISIMFGSVVFYQKFNSIKLKNQSIITEQKLLRSQMTPHFIFNSLSVLQGMILNKEEKKSITYLSKFSKLLRIVLENSRDKVVPLIQELDAIDNYMILQNLDTDPPYDYSLVVDENIDINLFLIPPMLIQPFIENAIEHAFSVDEDHREIEVHLTFKNKKLSCTITDNGIGIDAISNKPNTKKKSLATTITGERLRLLAKDFNVPSGITIEDRKNYQKQGTQVTLIIPYKIIENA